MNSVRFNVGISNQNNQKAIKAKGKESAQNIVGEVNKSQNKHLFAPITEPQCDTVCFKGVGKLKQIYLKARITKILLGGASLDAISKFMESLSEDEAKFVDEYLSSESMEKEVEFVDKCLSFQFGAEEEEEVPTLDQGRADFKEMNSRNWVQKYKGNPKLFEQLLLEEDTVEGETAKRLYFVQSLDVIRAFYKDKEALDRIYTRDNIIELERRSDGWGSPIKDLQIDCKDFIEKKMFETDEKGKIMLHVFAQEYNSADKFASPFLHVNQAYGKRLDRLTDMYLTKDSDGKYPLEYLKDKPIEEQQKALKIVKQTFQYEPEFYTQILATYDADYLEAEKELHEKVTKLMNDGFEFVDEDGNRVIAQIDDKSVAEQLIKGELDKPYTYKKYKKFNPKNKLIEDGDGDNFYTTKTLYFYDENGACIKKVRSGGSKYNGFTETLTLENGEWKSDHEGGWADW